MTQNGAPRFRPISSVPPVCCAISLCCVLCVCHLFYFCSIPCFSYEACRCSICIPVGSGPGNKTSAIESMSFVGSEGHPVIPSTVRLCHLPCGADFFLEGLRDWRSIHLSVLGQLWGCRYQHCGSGLRTVSFIFQFSVLESLHPPA